MMLRRLCLVFAALVFGAGPASAQDAKAEWWANVSACTADNRPACDRAVALADQLFERTSRDVATTWITACMAGDTDRCEIGYRRFKRTSFDEDPQPISHMFARASCFGGIYDLCRPWDDFETTDEGKRALVMAEMCMQGALPNTCYAALNYFRHEKGYHNAITYDLSQTLCERYKGGSACRAWAQALETNWDHRRAYFIHKRVCDGGLQESCPDAARLWKRVDYENRQQQAAEDARRQREAAAQQTNIWRSQLSNSGYSSPGYVRKPITPFGSSGRDIDNWNRFQKNLCLGNPTSTRC